MAGTVTSLNVRLQLQDANFTKGLKKAEVEAGRFSKTFSKVGGGVGALSNLASSVSAVAGETAGATSGLANVANATATMATTMVASTNVVFGLSGAMRTLKALMASNPVGIAIVAAAAAVGLLVSLLNQSNDAMDEAAKKADEAKKRADDYQKKLDDIEKRKGQAGMTGDEKELDDLGRDVLRPLMDAGEMSYSQAQGVKQQLAAAQQIEHQKEREKKLEEEIAKIRQDTLEANMTATEKRLVELSRLGASGDQLAAVKSRLAAADKVAAAEKARAELNQQLAELEKNANQAWMSDNEKKLAMLEALAKQTGQNFDRAKALQQLEAAAAPTKRKQELADRLNQQKSALSETDKQIAAINSNQGSGQAASPKALLRGTADALLAENRAKNPVELMTDLQKKSLEELKRQRHIQERQLEATQKESETIAQF